MHDFPIYLPARHRCCPRWLRGFILGLTLTQLALLTVLLVGCGYGQTTQPTSDEETPKATTVQTPSQAIAEVIMLNSAFEPRELTVKAPTTVVWTNQDSYAHTVTAGTRGNPSGLFDQDVNGGESFSFTFEEPGTYEYYCDIHPGMDGAVVVQE